MLAMAGVSKDYRADRRQGLKVKRPDRAGEDDLPLGHRAHVQAHSAAYYLDDIDETWVARTARRWNVERLIKEELAQPILRDAACAGRIA